MAVTIVALIESSDAPNAQTTKYTAPALTRTIIDAFTALNTTGGALTLSVNLVPSGGTAGATNLLVNKSLASGERYSVPAVIGQYLMAGDFISVLASATGITIRASGREVT